MRIDDEGRECSGCHAYKEWEAFAPSTARSPGGRQSACRDCRRERYAGKSYRQPDAHRVWLYSRLGITAEDYQWLFDLHGGNCHLHGGPETKMDYRSGRTWWLSVDHDHDCCPDKKACKDCIRGLLCADCNMALGLLERVGLAAERFADYLKKRPFQGVM